MARKAGMARREFLTRATTTAVVAAELPAPAAAEADSDEPADLPATDLEELERAVGAVVAGKRIGRPVFVRYTLPGRGKGRQRVAWLARMMQTVGQWMEQAPACLYAVGSLKEGAISLTVQFRDGASALLSVVRGKSHGDGVDLLVIGNHGALHYDSATAAGWDGTAAHRRGEPEAKLIAAIERACARAGRNVWITKDDAMKPARYGVLLVAGGQTHQENYAADFAADRRCRIVAVTDEADVEPRRRKLNEKLARTLGVPYVADLDEALRERDVQVVSICAPPERRGRIALRCARAGKHLYLDKSLTPRLAEADALVAAVKKAGVRSHMFSLITQPWARQAKRLLDEGAVGRLLAVHADAFFAKGQTGTAALGTPRKEEYPPQRQQLIEAKREWDNIGVYPVTLVRWLTGRKFATVYGVTGNYFFREHQKHDVEDFGMLCGTLEGGLPVTLAAGRYGWTTHPAAGVNRVTLVGSTRTLVVDANRPRLEVHTDEPPWTPPRVHPEDPMGFWSSTQQESGVRPKRAWIPARPSSASDAAYFLDCLEAGRESELSVAEAAHAAEVLLATYRSAKTGEVVPLPLPRE